MIKGSIYQDIATLNVYALNNRTIKYVKWKLTEIKREIYKYTITGKDFNTPILIIDRVTGFISIENSKQQLTTHTFQESIEYIQR